MRVGILLENKSPLLGGGYTFQEDLLHAVVTLRGETKHEFVLFCNPAYVDAHFGGLLRAAGIEVVSERPRNVFERVLLALNRESAAVRKLRKWFVLPTRLERRLRSARVELVLFLSMRAELIDIPYITVLWDLQHRVQPWFPELGARGEWDRREDTYHWFLRRATKIIVGTDLGRDELERFYQIPRDHVVRLPHPTPQFALNPAPSVDSDVARRHKLKPGYLFYPAQFWAHKNHLHLLLALCHLRDMHNSQPSLVLVGSDRGTRAFIEQRALELGLASQVRVLGFVSRDELIDLYRNAGALTYASFCGPENLPPLEAFALGCPVVAARYPGAEEQLGDAALLVDPAKPEEIAEAVKAVCTDGALRKQLIERGLVRARKWTAQDFVRNIFSVLDDFDRVRRCWSRSA